MVVLPYDSTVKLPFSQQCCITFVACTGNEYGFGVHYMHALNPLALIQYGKKMCILDNCITKYAKYVHVL